MGYRAFSNKEYYDLKTQHNIMVMVGNGFDIQVTRRYESRFSPRYTAFYHYLLSRDFNLDNIIVNQMSSAQAHGKGNWSDIEAMISTLTNSRSCSYSTDSIYEAIQDIQGAFSEYLEIVAPPDLLARIGRDSATHSLSVKSMTKFIGDVTTHSDNYTDFKFPSEANHYDLFNYLFVNFNYTPLLDDYIHLDQTQFEPRPNPLADRNFIFKTNPKNHRGGHGDGETNCSSYARLEIIHPHGQQQVPRSLLFGIDAPDSFDGGRDPHRRLMKPYWGMNSVEYGHLFPDTRLFIVFGCSLGESDGWWWRRLYESLKVPACASAPSRELIIYWWTPLGHSTDRKSVLEIFFTAAAVEPTGPERDRVESRIQVVVYTDDDPRVFLATP